MNVQTVAEMMILARRALQARGIPVTLQFEEDQPVLADDAGRFVIPAGYLVNLVDGSAPSDWPDVFAALADNVSASLTQAHPEDLTADQLRAQIRTRLVATSEVESTDLVWRPFASDLAQILCVDFPTTVVRLNIGVKLPLDRATLFRLGQANTDAEPVDEVFVVDGDVWCLAGESHYVAARAANFASLAAEHIGPAPHGIAFSLPDRHSVLFSVLSPEESITWVMALTSVTETLCVEAAAERPGGVISPSVYYWAPDGRVERISGSRLLMDGEPATLISPGPLFAEFLPIN